jgi:DNA (cytosine-5)-methyltransferase 1
MNQSPRLFDGSRTTAHNHDNRQHKQGATAAAARTAQEPAQPDATADHSSTTAENSKKPQPPLTVGSLFSGAGGFDLGLERQGFKVEFMCDNDPRKRAVLHRHWPDVPVYDDVTTIKNHPPVDVIVGGFPCQDLSMAGKRAGLAGERSGLFHEAARIAGESVRSGGWLIIENVPGLFSSNGGRDFAVVIRTLANLGFYDLSWRVLDSRNFGVPQRRRRVFIVARRARGILSRAVLLEPESGGGNHTPSRSTREEDPRELGHRAAGTLGKRGTRSHTELDGHGAYVAGALTKRYAKGVNTTMDDGALVTFSANMSARQARTDGVSGALTKGKRQAVSISENQRGEVVEQDYTRTIAKAGGKPGQGYQAARIGMLVRRLTPTECERLQGFPDGWTIPTGPSLRHALSWYQQENPDPAPVDVKPDGPRYAAMGDAVTVPVIEWLGQRLLERGQ